MNNSNYFEQLGCTSWCKTFFQRVFQCSVVVLHMNRTRYCFLHWHCSSLKHILSVSPTGIVRIVILKKNYSSFRRMTRKVYMIKMLLYSSNMIIKFRFPGDLSRIHVLAIQPQNRSREVCLIDMTKIPLNNTLTLRQKWRFLEWQ